MKFDINKKERRAFVIIGIIICLTPLIITRDFGWVSFKETGPIGDTIGGITAPFLNFFGAILIYLALKAQIDANNKIQDQFKIQQFESQFYKMVDIHNSNVRELTIPYYETINREQESGSRTNIYNPTEPESFSHKLAGKACFVDMVKELEYCLESVVNISESENLPKPSKTHFDLVYRIFFFGIYSKELESEKIQNDLLSKKLVSHLKEQQNDFRFSEKPFYKRNVKIRYIPFQGHESHLGHYYRNLFQTVKYVVKKENENLFSHVEAKQYFRLLRAQLSNAEQLMLYYNYICGFGANWDKLGNKGYEFFTKYRMIHNIPVNRVIVVENPREHFKDFICNHCSNEDGLFEWGDYRDELGCKD